MVVLRALKVCSEKKEPMSKGGEGKCAKLAHLSSGRSGEEGGQAMTPSRINWKGGVRVRGPKKIGTGGQRTKRGAEMEASGGSSCGLFVCPI